MVKHDPPRVSYGSIVEEGNDQNHEGREVELVSERKDGGADDDTDSDSAGVDRILPHTLENDTGIADGMNDGGESGLGQDDIGSATSSVSGTLDSNTGVGTGQGGASLAPSPVMAQRWPRPRRRLTISYLCSGKTPAKPPASKIISSREACLLPGAGPSFKTFAGYMWSPKPRRRPVSFATAS